MPIRLTEQQFFDYIFCPCKYDLKHNRKIAINNNATINDLLNKASKFFYMYVMNNLKTPSFNALSVKFESLFKPYVEVFSAKQYNDGLFLLRNFYNWACDAQVAVIDSDVKYVISHNGTVLEGIMNPIAINKDKRLEFLIMNYSSRVPEQLEVDTKLKYSLDTMAFNNSNKDHQIAGTKVHNVKSNKDITTSRNQTDYDRLLSTIDGVSKGIENEIYYPRESHMCASCPYKHYCRGWKKED